MNKSQFLNLLLGAVVIILGVKMIFFNNDSSSTSNNSNPVLENIYSRTSVRSYLQKNVEDEKIQQILKAGMSAPTAKNKQPWDFIVVKDKNTLKALSGALPNSKMTSKASVAIIACGNLHKAMDGVASQFWIQDVSAATENILLAAHGLNLGAVWTGVYPNDEWVKEIQKILHLPEYVIPLNVIPIGYPSESPSPKNKWKQENIHNEFWSDKK
jgi:Nitroreductase